MTFYYGLSLKLIMSVSVVFRALSSPVITELAPLGYLCLRLLLVAVALCQTIVLVASFQLVVERHTVLYPELNLKASELWKFLIRPVLSCQNDSTYVSDWQ